jgi:alanine racemase
LSFRKTRGNNFRIPVHVEVNMSMTRMDVVHPEDIQTIVDLPGLQVKGLMSHFANATDGDLVRQDVAKFEQMIANVKLRDPVMIHLAATGATVLWPETRRDLVRIGSGILSASNPLRGARETEPRQSTLTLWPTTVSVKSHVALLMRDVPVGSPVGYGSTYTTEVPKSIATLRFGHSNGYPSSAANHGWVLIRGKRFPIVGRLSQNVTNVDITNEDPQDPVRIGDEVVLLGPQGNDRITLPEIQGWAKEGAGEGAVPTVSTNLFLLSNPHMAVEGVASKLPVRHLTCGLCLDQPAGR